MYQASCIDRARCIGPNVVVQARCKEQGQGAQLLNLCEIHMLVSLVLIYVSTSPQDSTKRTDDPTGVYSADHNKLKLKLKL